MLYRKKLAKYYLGLKWADEEGGIHNLEVVAIKKGVFKTRFFQLIKYIRCPSSILKSEKFGVNHEIVKISQQM